MNLVRWWFKRLFCRHRTVTIRAATGAEYDKATADANVCVGVQVVCADCGHAWAGDIKACAPQLRKAEEQIEPLTPDELRDTQRAWHQAKSTGASFLLTPDAYDRLMATCFVITGRHQKLMMFIAAQLKEKFAPLRVEKSTLAGLNDCVVSLQWQETQGGQVECRLQEHKTIKLAGVDALRRLANRKDNNNG